MHVSPILFLQFPALYCFLFYLNGFAQFFLQWKIPIFNSLWIFCAVAALILRRCHFLSFINVKSYQLFCDLNRAARLEVFLVILGGKILGWKILRVLFSKCFFFLIYTVLWMLFCLFDSKDLTFVMNWPSTSLRRWCLLRNVARSGRLL